MCQSNYLEISRSALRRNAAAVTAAVGVRVIGILKCDGYGVTIAEAAAAWQSAGVTMFGVSRPEEALELRRYGFTEEVLLLSPVSDGQTLRSLVEQNVILTVVSPETARFYVQNASRLPVRVHAAVDTGMGRFGLRRTNSEQLKEVYTMEGLAVEGIFSHFSRAFEREYGQTGIQLSRFLQTVQALELAGCKPGLRHIANSCAALRFPDTRLDAVRIGSALVGRLPVQVPVLLERVSVFRARVVDCRSFQPGDTTGYGSFCTLKRHTRAAVVALGREDGFGLTTKPDRLRLRDLASWLLHLLKDWRHPPCVTFGGRALPLIGRVGSQFTLFDTAGAEVRPGDWVEWEGDPMRCSCERRFV